MTRQTHARTRMLILTFFLGIGTLAVPHAQAPPGIADLRGQLLARYDIVPLQRGVAFVPRAQGASVRMIQVIDGVVTVDGETLTGKQLADTLGRDARLIVQVSYLDRTAQREFLALGGSAAPEMEPPAPDIDVLVRPLVRDGDLVRVGGRVTVSKDERVRGEVVSILGGADIDGEVTRDVTVIVGPLNLGPNAVVRGDVTVIGGPFNRAAGAKVFGKIDEVGVGNGGLALGGSSGPDRGARGPLFRDRVRWLGGPIAGLVGSLTRIVLIILLGCVAVMFGRSTIERIGDRAALSPLRAGLVGLLAELLFVPVLVALIIVLAVSIVGIPLLLLVPFGVGAVMLMMLLGFAGAASHVGVHVTRRLGWGERGAYLSLALGVLTVAGLTFVARFVWLAGGGLIGVPLAAIGYLVEYLAWTIGFGALILTWFDRRHAASQQAAPPPPFPVTA